jgi:hypothetical protein
LERLASDKLPSLSQKFVNYDCKIFYNIGPRCQRFKVKKIDLKEPKEIKKAKKVTKVKMNKKAEMKKGQNE